MKSWNTQNNILKALLLALLFGTSSCSGEKSQPEAQATPQVPVEDESTRLKRAIAETDLASSSEMVAFNCRKLQKLLIGKALEEETQAKCAEAMLLMAKRASIGQQPDLMSNSPEGWLSEAESFGASKQSVSAAKREIERGAQKAAAEERRLQAAAEKALREGGVTSRKDMAQRMRTSFLDSGFDIKVRTSGRYAERVTFEFVLFNDVWSHRFQKEGIVAQLRDAGFERIDLTDGYDWHIYWTF